MTHEDQINLAMDRMGTQFKAVRPDRPGGYVAGSPSVRRAQFSWGCGNETTVTGTAFDTAHQRLPIRLPVATTRWRIRIANKNLMASTSTGTGTVNFNGVWMHEHFRNVDTGDLIPWWGNATPTQCTGSFSIGAAGEYVSPWFENANQQFSDPTKTYMVAFGWTKSGTTIYCGSGGATWGTLAETTTQIPTAGAYMPQVMFATSIEYEFVGSNKVGIAVGDSITEGAKSIWNMWSWHQRASMRLGMPIALSAGFGSTTNQWATWGTQERNWSRIVDGGLNLDFAIVNLGTNDYIWGVDANTLPNMKKWHSEVIRRIRSQWGVRDVYGVTLAPRGTTGTVETARLDFNNWLRAGQANYTDIFDIAAMLETAPDGNTLRASYYGSSGDVTHWGPAGQQRASQAILLAN